jgi:hypothetical protein
VVAITDEYIPATTPVASARRTRKRTAILLFLGFLSFAAVSIITYPAPREIDRWEGPDKPHQAQPSNILPLMAF